jgi:protein-S-isoprenylcysteine O-methyltransferase Ste14
MNWKWSNIPLPEVYLLALLLGGAMHIRKPKAITRVRRPTQWGGALNLLAGLLLGSWSVATAGDQQLSRPEGLVTDGPYRFSRNPMYLAWTFISSGLALLLNSLWMLATLPFAFLYLHFLEIPREEAVLAERFGEQYQRYRRSVRRYL